MRCGLVWRGDVDLFFLKRYLSESHKKIEIPTGIVFVLPFQILHLHILCIVTHTFIFNFNIFIFIRWI